MIELGKKYRTRDGREVRIYALDGGGDWPIHGAIKCGYLWTLTSWGAYGLRRNNETMSPADLIEVQPEVWHPIFINLCGEAIMSSTTYPTKEAAMAHEPVHPIDAWLDPRSGK